LRCFPYLCLFSFFLLIPPPPRSPLFPYTTLFRSHFTLDTASVEPMPTGLSSTSQPETGRPFLFPRRATIRSPSARQRSCGENLRSFHLHRSQPAQDRARRRGAGKRRDSCSWPLSFLVLLVTADITRHLG